MLKKFSCCSACSADQNLPFALTWSQGKKHFKCLLSGQSISAASDGISLDACLHQSKRRTDIISSPSIVSRVSIGAQSSDSTHARYALATHLPSGAGNFLLSEESVLRDGISKYVKCENALSRDSSNLEVGSRCKGAVEIRCPLRVALTQATFSEYPNARDLRLLLRRDYLNCLRRNELDLSARTRKETFWNW
jgi:hypothetical protein